MARQLLAGWPKLLTLLGVRNCIATALATRPGSTSTDSISFVQWNVHGECFQKCEPINGPHCDKFYPACKHNASLFLGDLLAGKNKHVDFGSPDFVGLEEWDEKDLLESATAGNTWGKLIHACGGSKGYGKFPFDSATIIYNKRLWDIRKSSSRSEPDIPIGGCMERYTGSAVKNDLVKASGGDGNYRAFIVQTFRRRSDGTEVIVVAAHYPHTNTYTEAIAALRQAVTKTQQETGIRKVVLIMDSNHNFAHPEEPAFRSSQNLMNDVFPDAGQAVSTEPRLTCCAAFFGSSYDRIVATGFQAAEHRMQTSLPFGAEVPSWVALSMHKPVAGRLTYSGESSTRILKARAPSTTVSSILTFLGGIAALRSLVLGH